MTEAYLLLLTVFSDEDIYIDHNSKRFVVTVDGKKKYVRESEVSNFITTFVDNKTIKDGK